MGLYNNFDVLETVPTVTLCKRQYVSHVGLLQRKSVCE